MEIDMSNYFWQGKRIRLRAYKPEDWEMKYQEFVDTETRRLLEYEVELPRRADEYARAIADSCTIEEGNRLSFAIENLDGEFIGWVNLHSRDNRNGTFSCGMGVCTPHQKKGYGEEAIRIVLRYAFFELRLQKCNASCLETNQGSLKLQQRLGFIEEGRRRRVVFTDGRFYDTILTGLTREEFEENDRTYRAR